MPNPYVNKVIRSNGTTLIDISDSTAVASDVATGKYFYLATGEKVAGTGSSAPAATAHSIYFEYEDSTSESITAYYDSAFVTNTILSSSPKTHGGKTVTLAQLDGNTWYSYDPSAVPLNTELIDFSKVLQGYVVNGDDGSADANEYGAMCDYTQIDPSMTFNYVGYRWWNLAFYDASKVFIDSVYMDSDADSKDEYDNAHGTLTPSKIPSNAMYVRISAMANYYDYDGLSLIRTA